MDRWCFRISQRGQSDSKGSGSHQDNSYMFADYSLEAVGIRRHSGYYSLGGVAA